MWEDSELYKAFDITYDYDIWPVWKAAVKGNIKNDRYLEMLRFQDCIYPHNFIKLRSVENHDRKRIMALAPSHKQALAWTAFQAFNKGAFLIYAGQESAAKNNPSLFEYDKIEWGEYELIGFIKKLTALKKDHCQMEGEFHLINTVSGIQAAWIHPEESLYGIFNTEAVSGNVTVELPDGTYNEMLSSKPVVIINGKIKWPEHCAIIKLPKTIDVPQFRSLLLDND
jgi:hypothetical protein